jgi:hypothetical protein
MRVLFDQFDQGTPVPLKNVLTDFDITTAHEMGWSTLHNGELLSSAEADGFDVFITTDQNLQHQQNLSHRKLAVVVLSTTSWPRIKHVSSLVVEAILTVKSGQIHIVDVP